MLDTTEGVLQQPQPVVLLEPEDDAVVMVLRFWADSDRNRTLKLKSAIMKSLK